MSIQSKNKIERDALKIPENARLQLAAKLLASVPASSRPSLSEEQALNLAESRAAEIDNGEIKGLDYREEMQRIRDSLAR
ncbi:MAG: addiction module protein [Gammaproteobacteria bacterium]